jgi:hypothetical protein
VPEGVLTCRGLAGDTSPQARMWSDIHKIKKYIHIKIVHKGSIFNSLGLAGYGVEKKEVPMNSYVS